jgi:Skp family chaperone for outer membrane proteins
MADQHKSAALTVGSVDMQKVYQEAPLVKSSRDSLTKTFQQDQAKMQALRATISSQQQKVNDLKAKKNKSAADDKALKQAEANLSSSQSQLQTAISTMQQQAMSQQEAVGKKIEAAVDKAIAEAAKQAKVNYVMAKGAVLYADPKPVDITEQVIGLLPAEKNQTAAAKPTDNTNTTVASATKDNHTSKDSNSTTSK